MPAFFRDDARVSPPFFVATYNINNRRRRRRNSEGQEGERQSALMTSGHLFLLLPGN